MSYVLDNRPSDHPSTVQSTQPYEDLYRQLVDQLRGEVSFLREELRRKDQLLAGFAQRLPALDVPYGESQSHPPPPEVRDVQPDQVSQDAQSSASGQPHRPWWKRW